MNKVSSARHLSKRGRKIESTLTGGEKRDSGVGVIAPKEGRQSREAAKRGRQSGHTLMDCYQLFTLFARSGAD